MARSQAALLGLVLLASSGLGCARREFRLAGTITIASSLQARAPKTNCVLFIVAKNLGGVPLAVRRVVNPAFPVNYTMGPEDLVVPGTHPRDALRVEVEMNTHGNVGSAVRGDLAGFHKSPVQSGSKSVHIVIDRQL